MFTTRVSRIAQATLALVAATVLVACGGSNNEADAGADPDRKSVV